MLGPKLREACELAGNDGRGGSMAGEASVAPTAAVRGTRWSDPARWRGTWTRTNVSATEDAEMIRFNVVIRGRGERGTKHGKGGDGDGDGGHGDGGDGNQHSWALNWAKRFMGVISSALTGRSYYDPHFRVEETEKRGDEVICANRTGMIL